MISGGGGGGGSRIDGARGASDASSVRHATVGDLTRLVRAKNAGPFRLTIDCFCDTAADWERLRDGLATATVAERLGVGADGVSRFELEALRVLKFSLPRPLVQGAAADRDLHGAQWALCVAGLVVG